MFDTAVGALEHALKTLLELPPDLKMVGVDLMKVIELTNVATGSNRVSGLVCSINYLQQVIHWEARDEQGDAYDRKEVNKQLSDVVQKVIEEYQEKKKGKTNPQENISGVYDHTEEHIHRESPALKPNRDQVAAALHDIMMSTLKEKGHNGN